MARQSYKPAFPRTQKQLRSWLKQTVEGRKLLGELTDKITEKAIEERCRQCEQAYRMRPKVLVVVRRLGPLPGVEVYAERAVNVRLEELIADTEDNAKLEIAADEVLALQVPKSWKHLLPDHCRDVSLRQRSQSMVFTGLTIERALRALEELRVLRELKATTQTRKVKR